MILPYILLTVSPSHRHLRPAGPSLLPVRATPSSATCGTSLTDCWVPPLAGTMARWPSRLPKICSHPGPTHPNAPTGLSCRTAAPDSGAAVLYGPTAPPVPPPVPPPSTPRGHRARRGCNRQRRNAARFGSSPLHGIGMQSGAGVVGSGAGCARTAWQRCGPASRSERRTAVGSCTSPCAADAWQHLLTECLFCRWVAMAILAGGGQTIADDEHRSSLSAAGCGTARHRWLPAG